MMDTVVASCNMACEVFVIEVNKRTLVTPIAPATLHATASLYRLLCMIATTPTHHNARPFIFQNPVTK